MLSVEKKRKKEIGGIDLSPAMNLWLHQQQKWKLIRRSFTGNRIGRTLILLVEENSDISHPLKYSL